jgi:hypothetical protein
MKVIEDWACYHPESGHDLAAEVREYLLLDFSHWKDHDAFEAAFARLLEALKATEKPPVPRALSAVIERKKRELRVLEEQQACMGDPASSRQRRCAAPRGVTCTGQASPSSTASSRASGKAAPP